MIGRMFLGKRNPMGAEAWGLPINCPSYKRIKRELRFSDRSAWAVCEKASCAFWGS